MKAVTTPTLQPSKTDWFEAARFGLFLHWGLYAVPGGNWNGETMDYIGEWIQARFRIPNREYETLAAQFHPALFDAEKWVSLAKSAGMRYVVFTAKHHDGFAMYGSKVDTFNIVDATRWGRDPLAELAEACRKHEMALGLYYSQDLDWHHPDGGDPGPDFPRNYGMSWGNDWDFPDAKAKRFERYFHQKALPQVEELLSRYGPISLLWFDCPMTLRGDDSHRLMKLVRTLQPDCLVNGRVGNGYGDFGSMGDNQMPVNKVRGIWECAATLNDTWGFKFSDQNWKTGEETLAILIGLASRGVNYLLNIGPQPDGAFPAPSVEVLEFLAGWMKTHSDAIHGTSQNPFPNEFSWGWVTAKTSENGRDSALYLIFKTLPKGDFVLRGVQNRVLGATISPDQSLPFSQSHERDCATLQIQFPETSAEIFPVVRLDLEGELNIDPRLLPQHEDEINLPSGAGNFVETESECSNDLEEKSGEFVGAAGERTRIENRPSLSDSGFVVNWLSPRFRMEWEFVAPAPGEYDIEILTCSPHHGLAWEGGHTVRLEIGGQSLSAALQADETVQTPDAVHYAKAISRLGPIQIKDAGPTRATLQPLEIQNAGGVGLSLVHVHLRPVR